MLVLVIGGAGFVGRRVVRSLAERGHEVVCLDVAEASFTDLGARVRTARLDLTDFNDVVAAMETHKPGAVINLSYMRESLPRAALKLNVLGMLEYAKANPGKLSYGSSGIGGANHVFMEMFLKTAKVDIVHVPYKGAALAIADTVSGLVPLWLGSVSAAEPFINTGKVIPLAVTGVSRWPTLPNVPTLAEAGYPDATMTYWMGILAPAGTPLTAREKLNEELRAILEEAPIRERLLSQGYETVGGSIADYDKFLQNDERTSRNLMQTLKLKVE